MHWRPQHKSEDKNATDSTTVHSATLTGYNNWAAGGPTVICRII